MFDKWTEKLMENAVSAYMPKLESIAEQKKTELLEMKSKVRTNPEQVEAWFEKEIAKLGNMSISEMLKDIKSNM